MFLLYAKNAYAIHIMGGFCPSRGRLSGVLLLCLFIAGLLSISMAVAGPAVAYVVYRACLKCGFSLGLSFFLAAFLGDLVTYLITSLQLACASPYPQGGVGTSLTKFTGIFAVTQVPLAVGEGLLTVLIFNYLLAYDGQQLQDLAVIPPGIMAAKRRQ